MKNLIYLLILTFGVISCSSDNEIDINNSDIIGEWNWKSTEGGIANNIHETPTSTGKIIHLNLMRNYKYSMAENGIEISSGVYELIMKKSIYSDEMERFIQLTNDHKHLEVVTSGIIKTYENNKLDISDNNFDGIASSFEKIE